MGHFLNSLPKSIFKVVIAVAARYEEASASLHLSKGISAWNHIGINQISQMRLLKHCAMFIELKFSEAQQVAKGICKKDVAP